MYHYYFLKEEKNKDLISIMCLACYTISLKAKKKLNFSEIYSSLCILVPAPFKEKNYVSPLTQKVHCLVELLQFFADFLCEKQFHTIFFVDFRALVQFCAMHQGLVFRGSIK